MQGVPQPPTIPGDGNLNSLQVNQNANIARLTTSGQSQPGAILNLTGTNISYTADQICSGVIYRTDLVSNSTDILPSAVNIASALGLSTESESQIFYFTLISASAFRVNIFPETGWTFPISEGSYQVRSGISIVFAVNVYYDTQWNAVLVPVSVSDVLG